MIRATNILLAIVALVLVVWDLITLRNGVAGDTISERVRAWNSDSGGLLAWCLAALWLHWFGPLFWK